MNLFNKWDSVYDCTTLLYIMVDEKFTGDRNTLDFSKFNIQMTKVEYPKDFIDNSSPNICVYLKFVNPIYIPRQKNKIYIFKKNKLYKFRASDKKNYYDEDIWYDELNNEVIDIWYDPFVFIHEKDYDQAIRYLKLKKINSDVL